MEVGERLREVRIKRNKTLEDVGLAIDASPTTISKYESGRIRTIPKKKLDAIARYLEVNPLYLLGYDEKDFAGPAYLSISEQIMLQNYRELDDIDQKTVTVLIERLLEADHERKNPNGNHKFEQLTLL